MRTFITIHRCIQTYKNKEREIKEHACIRVIYKHMHIILCIYYIVLIKKSSLKNLSIPFCFTIILE